MAVLTESQPARSARYVVIDYEGTGSKAGVPEGVVEIAAVAVCQSNIIDQLEFRLNPGIKIPAHISRIHGIYDKDLVGAPSLDEVRPKLVGFLNGMLLVAHNACVERRMLEHTLPDLRITGLLDSLRLSRKLFPQEKRHGLDDLILRFSLENKLADTCPNSSRHSALFDAQATALAFLHLLDEIGPECSVDEIISLCGINTTLANRAIGETQRSLFD
jgi:DNA polymerase III epsilon subunit-like protein